MWAWEVAGEEVETGTDLHTRLKPKQGDSGSPLHSAGNSALCLRPPGGAGQAGAGREVQDGEDICTHKADPQCHRADTNTTL